MPLPLTLTRTYLQFRKIGHTAHTALRSAHILLEWQELEAQGVVRLRTAPDKSYERDDDTCTCKIHKGKRYQCATCRHLERDGAVGIIGEYRDDPTEDDSPDAWTHADSIWGCVGYSHPSSPFENDYVIDIMQQTVEAYLTSNAGTVPQL